MKRIIFLILIFVNISVNAQLLEIGKLFQLSNDIPVSKHYKARDYIEMLPGFSVDATTGITFIAEIDPSIILEAEYNQPSSFTFHNL